MTTTSKNQIDINNFSGIEDLDDNAAANITGGMASFIAFDDDAGTQSPAINITKNDQLFNLAELSQQIGVNIDNIADRFEIRGSTEGERYRILAYDTPDATGNPQRFEFTSTGQTESLSLGSLSNTASSVSITQLS